MRQAFILISFLLLVVFPDQLLGFEFDFEFEDWSKIEKQGGNETASTIFANLALLCFIIANVYTPAKFLVKNGSANHAIKHSLSNLLRAHVIFNALMFVFTLLHAHYAEVTSVYFILSIIAMIGLIIGGAFLRYVPNLDRQLKKNLLRSQHILFGAVLFLLVLGHILIIE